MPLKIIQNKRYRLLVDIGDSLKAGDVMIVKALFANGEVVMNKIGDKTNDNFYLKITTFIHCVEPVEEPTFDNLVTNVMPKEEWPKVGVDMANGIDRAVFWQFVFKSYGVLLEAIEKMKAIARELSGK